MIGIVFINELNGCPYIDKYLKLCEENKAEYEIILWNRTGEQKGYPANYLVYTEKSDVNVARWKKMGAFRRYGKFVNKVIEERNYDKLIILTTLSALLIFRKLTRRYQGNYIFDFRDLSYEQIKLYRRAVNKIIEKSYFTCISSPGFRDVLMDADYIMAHNFRYNDINHSVTSEKKGGVRITLLHIGITRGEEYNKRLADVFGNDDRFEVFIVGRGNDTESFVKYASRFENIHVQGTYDNEEKYKYIGEADMLLYYYPCDFNCNRALANKYYDSLIYGKPLLGNIGTYSGKRLQEKGLGISLDLDDDRFVEKVYDYYTRFDRQAFEEAREKEMKKILEEDKYYLDKIREFILSA